MAIKDPVTLDTQVAVNPSVLYQDLEGEAVLLNLDTSTYFGLDEVGARIWALLAEGRGLRQIVAAITAEYEVAPAQCEADLLELVAELDRGELLAA